MREQAPGLSSRIRQAVAAHLPSPLGSAALAWCGAVWEGGKGAWSAIRAAMGLTSAGGKGRDGYQGVASQTDGGQLQVWGRSASHAPQAAGWVTRPEEGSCPGALTGKEVESKRDRRGPKSSSPAISFDRWRNWGPGGRVSHPWKSALRWGLCPLCSTCLLLPALPCAPLPPLRRTTLGSSSRGGPFVSEGK